MIPLSTDALRVLDNEREQYRRAQRNGPASKRERERQPKKYAGMKRKREARQAGNVREVNMTNHTDPWNRDVPMTLYLAESVKQMLYGTESL